MDKYEVYQNGFDNGICFGYIPDLTPEEMKIWSIGYNHAKKKVHLTVDEIYLLGVNHD